MPLEQDDHFPLGGSVTGRAGPVSLLILNLRIGPHCSSGNSDADNRRAVAAQLFDMLARMSTSVSIARPLPAASARAPATVAERARGTSLCWRPRHIH
jgi:hypothetical protein